MEVRPLDHIWRGEARADTLPRDDLLLTLVSAGSAPPNLQTRWCVPCGEEIPVLTAYTERPASIPALGANVMELTLARLAFTAEFGAHHPSRHDDVPDEIPASHDRLVDAADGRPA